MFSHAYRRQSLKYSRSSITYAALKLSDNEFDNMKRRHDFIELREHQRYSLRKFMVKVQFERGFCRVA